METRLRLTFSGSTSSFLFMIHLSRKIHFLRFPLLPSPLLLLMHATYGNTFVRLRALSRAVNGRVIFRRKISERKTSFIDFSSPKVLLESAHWKTFEKFNKENLVLLHSEPNHPHHGLLIKNSNPHFCMKFAADSLSCTFHHISRRPSRKPKGKMFRHFSTRHDIVAENPSEWVNSPLVISSFSCRHIHESEIVHLRWKAERAQWHVSWRRSWLVASHHPRRQ